MATKFRTAAQNKAMEKARAAALYAASQLEDVPQNMTGEALITLLDDVANELENAASLISNLEIES